MDTIVVLLVLLCCSPSGARVQTDTKDVAIGRDISPQVLEAESDIYTVLREIIAMVEQQRVELAHLKRENKAQTLQLKVLDVLMKQLEAQKLQLKEVDSLKKQLEGQAAALVSIAARSNITESQVEALERNCSQVRQVAFSASLWVPGHPHYVGPNSNYPILVYRNVFTNIGNAYNPRTGIFTAPVRGAYQFQFYVFGPSKHASGAALFKNKHKIIINWQHQSSGYWQTTANGVSLLLQKGDVVMIKLWPNAKIYDNGDHHSTFSGHLLFTM